jgi:hypothetical protein
MTRAALPTRQHIYRLDAVNGRVPLSLAEELKIKKPNAPIVAIDLGTLDNKDGYLLEPSKLYVEKVPNFLTKVENQPRGSKKGSFSSRNRRAPAADLIVTWCGESYALGKQGIISGGTTNLDHDKTDESEIVLRVLFALTLYDIGKTPGEQVHLSIAIPFESARDFAKKEAKIRQTIGESISWGAGDGSRSVEVLTLKIDPEDYHAELFSRFYSQDIPNFEGEDRATIGLGFRTCNLGFISADGYYDDVRSLSFDGKGTSLFYEWVGKEIGVEDWNNAYFIQAVNSGAETFRPQGSDEILELGEAIELARGWYVSEILKLVKKHTPSEIDRFIICGGGAIEKGPHLQKKLWGQSLICPESDIANSAGQLIELALELQAV